ncbi:RDD family protein [Streptomyces sp. NPDC048507]|uniref:RDD family protein n=1 Tax=Streptomyces sp. NPDC048507 TaxID=3365560 RepID=UPI00371D55F4
MTASPGDGEHAAREGYYPDPSIPGFVRYWNGAAWVPGTSRPAGPAAAPAEETGPVFLDETSATEALPEPAGPRPVPVPVPVPVPPGGGAERGAPGWPDTAPGPGGGAAGRAPAADPASGDGAAGWQADPAHQAGFGGPRDVRVSWGGPAEPEPRGAGISLARHAAATAAAAPGPARRMPVQAAAESVGILSARPPAWPDAPGAGTSGLTSSWPEAVAPAVAPAPAVTPEAHAPAGPPPSEVRGAAPSAFDALDAFGELGAFGELDPLDVRGPARPARPAALDAHAPAPVARAESGPRDRAPVAPARRAAVPPAPTGHPAPSGARADAARPVPPAEPARAVFERMAERAVRPAGLVRRVLARVLDSLVSGAVATAVALPLVPRATAHVEAKVDLARAGGRSTTVWLLDATTAGYLGVVLAAVLLFGVFYEALPTARWGRTPGKKLLGVRVLSASTLRPPSFGAALRRWLVYALLGLPGSLWCLLDRPRRRGWHDRAAGTYVAR